MGRVSGHRGGSGELTVRTRATDAARWQCLARIWIVKPAESEGQLWEVEHSRAYRDRLVLKLRGVDDPDRAEALRGGAVMVEQADAPALEPGEHFTEALKGCTVVDESGSELGTVIDVVITGGADVLVVRSGKDGAGVGEVMIPMAKEIVLRVDTSRRRIVVRPPAGLLELNRGRGAGETS